MDELFDDGKQEAVKMESEVPAIVPQEMNSDDRLMETVIKTGNIEALERYIALRERTEARQAKLEYDRHFSAMQLDFIGIAAKRTKQGFKYKYAPIEELQKTYNPIIFKHGFSYSWNEKDVEDEKKIVVMTINGWGHSSESSFVVPQPADDGQKNKIHDKGKQSTYGRRYTFISGFGLVIEDEDDDASGFDLDDILATNKPISEIKAVKSLDELASKWPPIYNEYKSDEALLSLLIKAKDKRKQELAK